MSDRSGIELIGTTRNPTQGCTRTSRGCNHRDASMLAKRLKKMGQAKYQRDGDQPASRPGIGSTSHKQTPEFPVRSDVAGIVFVNSMGDLFHGEVAPESVHPIFDVTRRTTQCTFQRGSCQRGGSKMRKTLITVIGALCIVAASTTAAMAATAVSKSATRSNVTVALSASAGMPTTCPPAAAVGKALGLSVSKPTVVVYAKGISLECSYTSKKEGKTTLSYTPETQKVFLAQEKSLPKTSIDVVTSLGNGVSAFLMPPYMLEVQKGTVECIIETKAGAAKTEALAGVLLNSYW